MATTLMRKITGAKWHDHIESKDLIVSADAITSCLKTKENKLSCWNTDNLEDVVLIFALTLSKLARIDIVKFDESFFTTNNIDIIESSGITKISHMVNFHKDLINLDYDKLGIISSEIKSKSYNNDKFIIKYEKSAVKKLLLNSLERGTINKADLDERLQKDLKIFTAPIN